jgi:hypothetical protein
VQAHPNPLHVGLVVGQNFPDEIAGERSSNVGKLKDFPHHQQHDQAPVGVDCNISLQLLFHAGNSFAHSQALHASCYLLMAQYKRSLSFINRRLISFLILNTRVMGCNRPCKHLFQDSCLWLGANTPSTAMVAKELGLIDEVASWHGFQRPGPASIGPARKPPAGCLFLNESLDRTSFIP